jgi:predicted permease
MTNSRADKPSEQVETPIWRRYLRFRGADVRADVADELEFHVEMIASCHVANGMTPDQARARAREEFGDLERARRLCEGIGAEQARRHEWSELVDSVGKDVRFALRAFRRSPGFTVAIVLTLALGIGASTAIFSIVSGVLLRSLPYADPNRLVRIWEVSPSGDDHNVASIGNYSSWLAQAKSFSVMGVHRSPIGVSYVGDGDPTQITVVDATPSAMQALGTRAALGRSLTPDDATGDGRIAVLSHDFWERRFGLDRTVIGRRLMLNGVPFIVAGVMPENFEFPSAGVDLWRPVTDDQIDSNERRSHNWYVIARLAPDATLQSANVEMRAIAGALGREYPQFMTGFGTNVVSMADDLVVEVRPLLLVLMAGAMLLLLVACANIANLLLARAVGRRREMAVRGALGAGRGRLMRQLITESLVIAVLGGTLGVGAATVLTRALVALAPTNIPRLAAVHVDAGVLAFGLAMTVASGLLFGLAPAVRLVTADRVRGQSLHLALRASGDRAGSGRTGPTRSLLLVGELAVSLVLLTGAGLLLRSAHRLARIDYGYRADGIVTAALDLPRARYDGTTRHVQFYDRLIERVGELPTVAGVAGSTEDFGTSANMTFSFAIDGHPSRNASGREDPQTLRVVAGDYFRVMGIPVRRGRAFAATDRADAPPVIIVNDALARLFWSDRDPVGTRISFSGASGPWLEIVGVVGDTRSNAADQAALPAMYMPFAQKRWNWMSWLTLVVRTEGVGDTTRVAASLRGVVRELDAELPIHRVATAQQLYRESIARRRFATALTGAFAAAALLLGMVGMYGVLSYGVVQRRREFGIRIALGARAGQVTRVVVREALTLAAVAVVVGTAAALALTRLLGGLLFEVSPTDPATFIAVAMLVTAVAAVAAWVPARRATRIDPATTIRDA